MGLNQQYFEIRQRAIEWVKKEKPDFDEGVKILQDAGYKPYVVAVIAKRGADNKFAREKLFYEITAYIRLWSNPEAEEHKDENPTNGNPDTITSQETIAIPGTGQIIAECIQQGYPPLIRRCLHEFYALMKERQAHHLAASEIIGDDEVSNNQRKVLFEQVEALSERMDTLWSAKEKYDKEKILPDESLFAPAAPPASTGNEKQNADNLDLSTLSLEQLKQKKKNLQSKRTKANNMLEFQQDKKADKPNPMPEGPKRLNYQKKVEQYTKEIEQIDYRIVELS